MAACYWYGTAEDHRETLVDLFDQPDLQVWESASRPGKSLQRFSGPDDVLAEFDRTYPNGKPVPAVYLRLFLEGTGPGLSRRIAGTREHSEGMGLVTFHLGLASERGLEESWSGAQTKKGALRWHDDSRPATDVTAWDFDQIRKRMERLYRRIRKRAIAKVGRGVSVLPGAAAHWEAGRALAPFEPKIHPGAFRKL